MSLRKRRKRKDRRKFRGTFLIPNLITTASLFSGFFAIVSSINGRFESAALAILVAMVLDGLDGRLARRIVPAAAVGDVLAKGAPFGMICFGSRVDLYIPRNCVILVKVGDRVKAGETIIGRCS